jgi:phosphoribosyl 1,2-cyclic phosphodiesterase
MRVTLFGTRGSLPAPGPESARYGGNTSTVELRGADGSLLVLDAGTGIRRLGAQLPPRTKRVDILLTHLHMDHIQGLGFFAPLFDPKVEVHIWGPASAALPLEARLARYLSPPLFPVHLRDLPSVTCHEVPSTPFTIGPFRIEAAYVCHPNPTVGYRIESGGVSIAYLPDHEPALGLREGGWLEPEWTSGHALAAGVDLLLHDAQYSDEEYVQRVGWGHSSYRHAFEFAARAGARELVPFHHDPGHDDAALDRLLAEAVRRAAPPFRVSPGREGAVFEIGCTAGRPGAADGAASRRRRKRAPRTVASGRA